MAPHTSPGPPQPLTAAPAPSPHGPPGLPRPRLPGGLPRGDPHPHPTRLPQAGSTPFPGAPRPTQPPAARLVGLGRSRGVPSLPRSPPAAQTRGPLWPGQLNAPLFPGLRGCGTGGERPAPVAGAADGAGGDEGSRWGRGLPAFSPSHRGADRQLQDGHGSWGAASHGGPRGPSGPGPFIGAPWYGRAPAAAGTMRLYAGFVPPPSAGTIRPCGPRPARPASPVPGTGPNVPVG